MAGFPTSLVRCIRCGMALSPRQQTDGEEVVRIDPEDMEGPCIALTDGAVLPEHPSGSLSVELTLGQ